MRRSIIRLTVFLLLLFSGTAKSYGPYDYTNPVHVRKHLPIVERSHFNRDVESLRRGQTTKYVVGDIAYTLRVFPNHHRALHAMDRLWRKNRKNKKIPPGANSSQPPSFWFDRAITFAPHDGIAHLLYGIHLHKSGNRKKALSYYNKAEKLNPNSSEIHYNLGLLYVDLKDYDNAKVHAKKAYDLGYPLPGLRNKLIAAGVWTKKEGP